MKHYVFSILILLGLALLTIEIEAAGGAKSNNLYMPLMRCPTCSGGGGTGGENPPSDYPAEVIRLVNIERTEAGCPAALQNQSLMQGTQAWSEYMASSSDYRHSDNGWYPAYGYLHGTLENLGGGDDPYLVVNAWMNSIGHRTNILYCPQHDPIDPAYNPNVVYDIGVGYASGYWTLAIGSRLP